MRTRGILEAENPLLFQNFFLKCLKLFFRIPFQRKRKKGRLQWKYNHYERFSTARNASCESVTLPICFMRFFPFFCFSRSFILRVMSPPYRYPVTSLRNELSV